MPITQPTERLLHQYLSLRSLERDFIRDTSFGNVETRSRIRDPRGRPMLSQPDGVVLTQLRTTIDDKLDEIQLLPDGINQTNYQRLRDEYYNQIDSQRRADVYVKMVEAGIVPANPSQQAQEAIDLLTNSKQLDELVTKGKTREAYEMLVAVLPREHRHAVLAGQYDAMGQESNVAGLVSKYADMRRREARKAIDENPGIQGEIDNTVARTGQYARAFAEVYKTWQWDQVMRARAPRHP